MAQCDCCSTDRACVRLHQSEIVGDTYACHVCTGTPDADCDECQQAEPTKGGRMDRYGIASGTRIHETIADRAFRDATLDWDDALSYALCSTTARAARQFDREVVESTRRLVRAARDVERQRAFERGIAAFAAMPMFRRREAEQNAFKGHGYFTGD